MPKRDSNLLIDDMLVAIRKIESYTTGMAGEVRGLGGQIPGTELFRS